MQGNMRSSASPVRMSVMLLLLLVSILPLTFLQFGFARPVTYARGGGRGGGGRRSPGGGGGRPGGGGGRPGGGGSRPHPSHPISGGGNRPGNGGGGGGGGSGGGSGGGENPSYPTYCCSGWYNGWYNGYYGGYYTQGAEYWSGIQYDLTINLSPSNITTDVSGDGTYSKGSTASFSANQTAITEAPGMRYVFTGWSGDYTGSGMNATLTMDAAKTVTANYQPQYFVSVSQQPSNAPTPQGGGWFNEGATTSISVPNQNVSLNAGAQFVFTGWTVDGNSQTGPTLSLQMNSPHTVVAQYTQQYYLTVQSPQGITSGQGWYNAGTNAPISVSTPPSPMFGVNWVFDGWQGSTQSSTQSTTVLMNGPMTVTATWHQDSTVLYVTVGAIIAIIAVAAFAIIRTKRKNKQIST